MIKIDALSFLLLVEALIVLLAVTLVLLWRAWKDRGRKRIEDTPQEQAGPGELPSSPDAAEAQEPGSGELDSLRQTVEMLKKMVHDMLSCKQVFDTAPARLSGIQAAYRDQQERSEQKASGAGQQEMEAALGSLKAEQETLAVKFRIWEGQFNKLQGDETASITPADEIVRTMMSREKEELLDRTKAAEDALAEKTNILKALQAKYDNLEKEYEILYRQQQNAGDGA
ncbi:MAG TPA: hypothetical protein VL197_03345 [Nitrospirota bacterium]|nr:hypothetical protein [Nitrospirota bacterium]